MSDCPIKGARGLCQPEGRGSCGVLILGEALGEDELNDGCFPFRPFAQAGSVLERAIRRIGVTRDMFVLYNAIPTHPPANYIAPEVEHAAIEWGRPQVEQVITHYRPRCILCLGNIATRAATGLSGRHLGVGHLTGYVLPSLYGDVPVIPCFHPSFLRRGAMGLFGVLMRCLRLAMLVARDRRQPQLPPVDSPPPGYILMPSEEQAREFLYQAKHHEAWLTFDIETMYSVSEEDAEERPDDMRSIQFSLAPETGIFMPWREPYIEIAKDVLKTPCKKAGHNVWRFDNPILKQNGCEINGKCYDTLWMWHANQPDLPRGLQFVLAMQGSNIYTPTHSWQWPYKHLSNAYPQFYGVVDVAALQWLLTY